MPDFTLRSDSVNVEEIMQRIRARIREKRGVDYTEEEIRELANVKLEKFLDPRQVRSDLIEHYRRRRPVLPPWPEKYSFEHDTIYESSRGLSGRIIETVRRLLNPLLKLFFNPNPLIQALHRQTVINDHNRRLFERHDEMHDELDALNYEVLNNLVVEMTRLGIEVKNLKMRVESLSSRLDFDERRARALEGVVQYRPGAAAASAAETAAPPESDEAQGEGRRARRRRRRRRRAGGGGAGDAAAGAAAGPASSEAGTDEHDDTASADAERVERGETAAPKPTSGEDDGPSEP